MQLIRWRASNYLVFVVITRGRVRFVVVAVGGEMVCIIKFLILDKVMLSIAFVRSDATLLGASAQFLGALNTDWTAISEKHGAAVILQWRCLFMNGSLMRGTRIVQGLHVGGPAKQLVAKIFQLLLGFNVVHVRNCFTSPIPINGRCLLRLL